MAMPKKIQVAETRFVRAMTPEQHRHFVNSLRHALGLLPLYGQPKETPWYVPFMGDGNRRATSPT